jgi:hypothetical protein
MPQDRTQTIKIIDSLIFSFFVLFLATLTNSIFFNQVGYYFALALLLLRWSITKENPFEMTGLEYILIWYIAAEIISLILTKQPGNAFHNLIKRLLWLPVIYTTIAATTDFKKAKLFLKIYLIAAVLTAVIYLYFSYQFVIYNLYSIKGSGPSLFQYPITTSEIASFTITILFAFLINEKGSLKNKLFISIGILISSLALISTYKRTGWIGAAFGIFIILLIKKQWKILFPAFIIIIFVFATAKNKSEIHVFNYKNNQITKDYNLKTSGRAYDVYDLDSTLYISDYEDGLLKVKNRKIIGDIKLASPVINFVRWEKNYYLANLIDSRFILLEKNKNSFNVGPDFLSPGYTASFTVANGYLYILDVDSGLTVFKNPNNKLDSVRFIHFAGFSNIFVDSNYAVAFSHEKGLAVFSLKNYLPYKQILNVNKLNNVKALNFLLGKIFIDDNDGLKLFKIDSAGLNLINRIPYIKNAYKIEKEGDKIFILTLHRKLFEISLPENDSLKIVSENNIDFTPQNFSFYNGKFYFPDVERNRLLSIFDFYLPSNFNRLAFWRAGLLMFNDHPLFGVGDIDLANLYRQYKRPFDKEIQGHMHNNFIHVLVTLGLFGFAAVCALFFMYYKIVFNIYKNRKSLPFVSSFALGVIGAFSAFMVSGLTELNFWNFQMATLIFFIFGLNFAFYKFSDPKIKNDEMKNL